MNTIISPHLKKTTDRLTKDGKVVRVSQSNESAPKNETVQKKDNEIANLKQELAEIKKLLKQQQK